MKRLICIWLLFSVFIWACNEKPKRIMKGINHLEVLEDLEELVNNLKSEYAYLHEKGIDINCIKGKYEEKIDSLKTNADVVLFFEYILDEFYDNHLTLNTNVSSSYRLYSPIHVEIETHKVVVKNVWQSQIESIPRNIVNAEVIAINKKNINDLIDAFPVECANKINRKTRTWIANKIIAGRYNEPRILTLKLNNDELIEINLDEIKIKKEKDLLVFNVIDNIGIIRINNSLGRNELISRFDNVLDSLINTDGLVLDIRNTVDGGNSYVARGILSRFIAKEKPYQKHSFDENYSNQGIIKRIWVEYVRSRGIHFTKPLVILVGRWTGSMGEGVAIGFDGMKRGVIVGSEMEKLAGSISNYKFKYRNFGYNIPTEKLYHVNGSPRESFVPTYFVEQRDFVKDEVLEKGLEIIRLNSKQ